jgi:uncharacterized protein
MPDTAGIQVARPSLRLAGQADAELGEGLMSLAIVENTLGLYRCEALVGNWGTVGGSLDYLYFDRRKLDFGKAWQVCLNNDVLFDGRITGLEAVFPSGQPPQLRLLAEDRFQDLRMTRRTRTFADLSDADLFRQIAGDHGLRSDINVNGPTYKVLAQVNQSDLALLRERARAIDADLWMEGDTLHARGRTAGGGSPPQLRYQAGLRQFTSLADLAGQRTSVIVSGWDVSGKAGICHEATAQILAGELGQDQSGAAILDSAFGARKETVAHAVPLTSDEAQAAAEAAFRMTARRFVVGRGIADTDARLRVGSRVELLGLGPLFSGKYLLAEVLHLFDGVGGLRTEFTAERAGIGRG